MFTGIIETLGEITNIKQENTNIHFTVKSNLTSELKIDQSLSHNGVCLTVVNVNDNEHTVTAVAETLQKTNLGKLKVGKKVNLERAMQIGSRLDGHFVQGHVDQVATIIDIKDENGSWLFTIEFEPSKENMVVNKGSVCLDGVSLTVLNPVGNRFSLAIIPYTYEHTLFCEYKIGDMVNIEFDIVGKYFLKYVSLYANEAK
jgi:riboflavin synthase